MQAYHNKYIHDLRYQSRAYTNEILLSVSSFYLDPPPLVFEGHQSVSVTWFGSVFQTDQATEYFRELVLASGWMKTEVEPTIIMIYVIVTPNRGRTTIKCKHFC